eukprot:6492114-Amphidinium_carterae.1
MEHVAGAGSEPSWSKHEVEQHSPQSEQASSSMEQATDVASVASLTSFGEHATVPDHHGVEIEMQAKSAGSDVVDTDTMCTHCTRYGSPTTFVNHGCKRYPKFRCKACHTAVRALERSAKSRGTQEFEKFCTHRRQQPLQFNQLVLAVRLRPEGETPLPGGEDTCKAFGVADSQCESRADRKERMVQLMTSIFSEKGVESFEEVRWLSERQFKAFMKSSEDMSALEAQQSWDRAMVCKETERRQKRGQVQVAVLTAEGKRKYHKRGSKRAHVEQGGVSEDDEDASKRLRGHIDGDDGIEHAQDVVFNNP